jgi:hypothetical protein
MTTTGGDDVDVEYAGVRFRLPFSLADRTVLAFVDRDDAPTLSVTVAQETLAGGKPALLRYVTDQLAALRRELPGFTVVNQREDALGGAPAVTVEALVQAGRDRRGQRQLYVLDEPRQRVIVATVSAQQAHDKRAAEALDELVRSLQLSGGATEPAST